MTRLVEADEKRPNSHATPDQQAAALAYIEAQRARWAVWLCKPDEQLQPWQVRVKRNRQQRLGR